MSGNEVLLAGNRRLRKFSRVIFVNSDDLVEGRIATVIRFRTADIGGSVKRYYLAAGLGMWSVFAPGTARAQVEPETYHFVCMSGPWVQSNNITGLVAYGADPVTAEFKTYAEAVAYEKLLEGRFEAQAEKAGQLQYADGRALVTCRTFSATSLEDPDRRRAFESYLVEGPGYETIGNQRIPIKRANIPTGWAEVAGAAAVAEPPAEQLEVACRHSRLKTSDGTLRAGSTGIHRIPADKAPIFISEFRRHTSEALGGDYNGILTSCWTENSSDPSQRSDFIVGSTYEVIGGIMRVVEPDFLPADWLAAVLEESEPAVEMANSDEALPTAAERASRAEEISQLAAQEREREAEAERERDRLAAAETARLNREMAEFASEQVAQNEAARRKAEVERQAYEAELARVEQEKARHELAMEQHRREREEANRRQQEYFAAQRRHALCIGGDKKACADIEAGKPALADASTNEEASTEQDATRCVSAPVVSADPTFRGSTQAVVVNGCDAPVDVRVCLMRTGGWNCGTTWNLAPQGRWAHTSFESDGQVFWDARVSTASRALAKP